MKKNNKKFSLLDSIKEQVDYSALSRMMSNNTDEEPETQVEPETPEQPDYAEMLRQFRQSQQQEPAAPEERPIPMKYRKERGKGSEGSGLVLTKKSDYGIGDQQDSSGHRKYKLDSNGEKVYYQYKGQKLPIFIIAKPYVNSVSNTDNPLVPTGQGSKYFLQNMATIDPKSGSNEPIPGVIYSNEVIETNGESYIYLVRNYGVPGPNGFSYNFIDASNGRDFHAEFPKEARYGSKQKSKYEAKSEFEMMLDTISDPQEKQRLINEKLAKDTGYAKSRISSALNVVFDDEKLVDKLHGMFVADIVGDNRYTEMRSNVIKRLQWGVSSPEIMVQYNSIIDAPTMKIILDKLQERLSAERGVDLSLLPEDDSELLSDIFGSEDDEEDEYVPDGVETLDNTNDTFTRKPRGEKRGDYMRRAFGGYIYSNGEWKHTQRVGSPEEFQREKGLTPVKRLNPKDIQRGRIHISSKSDLYIHGNIVENKYVLNLRFDTDVVFRPHEQDDKGIVVGNILGEEPLTITLERELPEGLNSDNLRLGDSSNDKSVIFLTGKNGIITEGLVQLSNMLQSMNTEFAVQKMMNIIAPQQAINESRGNKIILTEEQVSRLMKNINNTPKKIKLSEGQVSRLMSVISEEKYDDMISNFKRSASDGVTIPHDEAVIMFNIVTDWCQKRTDDVDCESIMNLKSKLNI